MLGLANQAGPTDQPVRINNDPLYIPDYIAYLQTTAEMYSTHVIKRHSTEWTPPFESEQERTCIIMKLQHRVLLNN